MKILLHGATNCGSSNYGDFIYAYEIFQHLVNDNQVDLFQPSEYFKKYFKLEKKNKIKISKADVLVYLPGGYFGEGHNARVRDNIVQFLRFMPFGIIGIFFRKPIIVVGVGAGPLNSWFMRFAVKYICKYAKSISVRDEVSYQTLQNLGIREMHDYFDMILAYPLSVYDNTSATLKQIDTMSKGKKILLVHYNHSFDALRKFAQAVNEFIETRKDKYVIIVSSDSILENEDEMYQEFNRLCDFPSFHYIYDNPFEFTELLRKADLVLSCKLHVGVVAAMFNKSVICAAEHPEKTTRFYSFIGESSRCTSLYEVDPKKLSSGLMEYEDKKMYIDAAIKDLTMMHWKMLDSSI